MNRPPASTNARQQPGIGDRGEHRRQAASHWAAATADKQRADRAEALVSSTAKAEEDV
jgi:hypothetical protein